MYGWMFVVRAEFGRRSMLVYLGLKGGKVDEVGR